MLSFLDQKFYSPPSSRDKRLKVFSKKALFCKPDDTVYEPLSPTNQSTPLSTCLKSCKYAFDELLKAIVLQCLLWKTHFYVNLQPCTTSKLCFS